MEAVIFKIALLCAVGYALVWIARRVLAFLRHLTAPLLDTDLGKSAIKASSAVNERAIESVEAAGFKGAAAGIRRFDKVTKNALDKASRPLE